MRFRTVGAAVRGSAHVLSGAPCQDAFSVTELADGVVLAVADGAGSRERSQVGAQAATEAVAAWAAAGAGELAAAFGAARVAVRNRAAADGCEAGEYACTLAVAVLAGGTWTVGQIGDGIAVASSGGGPVSLFTGPEREYVNQTDFLTTLGAAPEIVSVPAGPLALMTDGVRMKVLADLRTGEPYPDFFADVWAWAAQPSADPPSLARFLEGLDDQTGDDKTLVLAVPR